MPLPTIVRLVLAVVILFAAYLLLQLVPLLVAGPTDLGSFLGRAVQCALAIAVAVALAQRRRWAATGLVLLGAAVAATALYDAFVPGILALLHALAIAAVALLAAFYLAQLVRPALR
jgi:hypothetical protein